MGQKVHPYGFRLGFNRTWHSRWFSEKDYQKFLHDDLKLRRELKKRLSEIEVRSTQDGAQVSLDGRVVGQTPVNRLRTKPGSHTLQLSKTGFAAFGKRAKEGTLTVDEMTGGTFTISNGGVFCSLLSTPIINPPQSAILGVHATKERPVAENGQIVIRPMNYLALSYDHRIIDGREAVLSLVAIKEALEDPARLVLEI